MSHCALNKRILSYLILIIRHDNVVKLQRQVIFGESVRQSPLI